MRWWRGSTAVVGSIVGAAALLTAVGADAGSADDSARATAVARRVDPPTRTFTIVLGGDILTENLVLDRGAAAGALVGERYDFAPMFSPVRGVIEQADLAICHMELPVGWPGQRAGYWGRSPYGGNLLLAPFEMAESLRRTGFDRCSTASNHSNDLGVDGIDSTLAALDAAGLTHAGTASQPDQSVATSVQVNGASVAHLAYTRYSNTVRPREPWRLAFAATPAQVALDVDAARAAGAQVVIVSLHLSQEMQTGPTADDRAFATALTALTDVDAVVHHGPHVVQPLEVVNGTPVWWSLGNFVSAMGRPGLGRYSDLRSRDGLLAVARFTQRDDGSFAVTASSILVCNEGASRTVHAPVRELADPSLDPALRAELQACVDRTVAVVPDIG